MAREVILRSIRRRTGKVFGEAESDSAKSKSEPRTKRASSLDERAAPQN